ncbi:hypothetical protein SAY87_028056 [Trapa incisa]|uniref:Eukaryotic translation initiation factor 3 subunit E N-terminal domain-containing protein n=1 Tax=Trapa incisa TaxID=236973 RepID=A0AAN7KTB2_9MYRT|nr:hypothetical protein SAY87_028056 [Trapa incisa]
MESGVGWGRRYVDKDVSVRTDPNSVRVQVCPYGPNAAHHSKRHLVFPSLEFLQVRQIYPDEEILKSKIELLGKISMVDYAMDIHKSLYHTEDVPQGILDS